MKERTGAGQENKKEINEKCDKFLRKLWMKDLK